MRERGVTLIPQRTKQTEARNGRKKIAQGKRCENERRPGRPVDGKVAGSLSSTIVERSGFGMHSDRLQKALSDIDSELKKTDVPDHGRAWLEKLKHNTHEIIKASPLYCVEHEFLGWS